MSKIVVTGANGYIGRKVVDKLIDLNHEVIALDIKTDDINDKAIKMQEDIFNCDESIYDKLGKPDVCIHLAWRNGFIHNSQTHLMDLQKHYNFIKNMIDGGLKNISIMGTMHEVGYWEGPINDKTPCNPQSLYGIAKNALRHAVTALTVDTDVNLYWLRAYYILGDDEKSNSIFGKIINASKDGKKEFPFTSGKNKYDFITLDELAKQIAMVSVQTDITGIINVCTGQPISLAEKVEGFIKENDLDIKLIYGAFPDRKYDSPAVWGDPEVINKIINN